MEERAFLLSGGNDDWLKDTACVPNKLRRLDEINKLLAQSPSLLTTNHIKVRTDYDDYTLKKIFHLDFDRWGRKLDPH